VILSNTAWGVCLLMAFWLFIISAALVAMGNYLMAGIVFALFVADGITIVKTA
jgi:hypothetical protein